jgi:hemerythrin superfamily protein
MMKHTVNTRVNLYNVMHKYLRVKIADAINLAGTTDFSDQAERNHFNIRFNDLTKLLDDHAKREEKYIHPLLPKNQELESVEAEHVALDRQLATVTANLAKISDQQAAYQFYLDLAQFQADYTQHLIAEERRLLPELQKHCSDEQLSAASREMLADMPKDAMVTITKGMLPAINHSERASMFSAMKAGMPPAMFASVLNLAAQALPPEQTQKLCLAVGVPFAELAK